MSTLVTATVKSNSSSPPAFQNSSGTEIGTLCRAWVNFGASSGTPSIRANFNVSSITDNGVGDFTVNFSNAMSDANYSVYLSGHRGGGAQSLGFYGIYGTAANAYTSITSSSVRVNTADSAGSGNDYPAVCVAIFR